MIQTLAPTREVMADAFVVLFTTSREDVKKATMLGVPREEYMRCARLRAKVCLPLRTRPCLKRRRWRACQLQAFRMHSLMLPCT